MKRLKNCFYGTKGISDYSTTVSLNNLPEDAKKQLNIVGINSATDYEDNNRYKLAFVPHVNHKPMYIFYLILLLTVFSSVVAKIMHDCAYLFMEKYHEDVVLFQGSTQIELILCIISYGLFIHYAHFFVREVYDNYIKPYCLSLVRVEEVDYDYI